MTTNDGPSRRELLAAVAALVALLDGRIEATKAGQRRLVLPLDGVEGIEVRYRGATAFVSAASIFNGLSAKEP